MMAATLTCGDIESNVRKLYLFKPLTVAEIL